MRKILIIEDNNDIRENTVELLELEGYRVLFAENGRAGFELAQANKPDVVVCDIMMPEADGYEVFNLLKNDVDTMGIPFIFLTASVERKDIQAGLAMGAKAYIQKPLLPEDLFEAITKCLAGR